MRLTKWAARLYPRWWQERYGEEFAALLEDARPGFGGTVDVARGAMAMQMVTWPAKRIVALGALVGVVGGLSMALLKPKYESAVSLVSTAPMGTDVSTIDAVKDFFAGPRLISVVRDLNLYSGERMRQPLGEIMEQMRRDISVIPRAVKDGNVHELELRFRYADPATSQKAAKALAAGLAKAATVEMQVIPNAAPSKRLFPNVVAFTLTGSLGGFVATGIFALGLLAGRRQRSTKQE